MPQEIQLEHTKEGGHSVSMQKMDWGGKGGSVSLAPLPDQGKLNNPCKLIGQAWSAS